MLPLSSLAMQNLRLGLLFATLATAELLSGNARAGESDILILPTVIAPDNTCEVAKKEQTPIEPSVVRMARHVDSLLSDSVQDLDLNLEIAPPSRPVDEETQAPPSDDTLVTLAASRWVISPRLVIQGSRTQLKLVSVAPGSSIVASRTQYVDRHNVDVRTVVMLGTLVQSFRRGAAAPSPQAQSAAPVASPQPVRSEGRGVLAVSSALLGGFTGYWLQRASGSSDPRVSYPLAALGAGIGLGASMLAADEWDVTLDDAWTLTAGMSWPTASGFLIAEGRNVPATDRYVYGLLGAGTGLTLASVSISLHHSTPGSAIMAHSGGAFGTFLGALSEWTYHGNTDSTPYLGMGLGAGLGVLSAGLLATQVDTTSTRVLFIDLAASLGALSGAALASSLLVVDTGKLPLNESRANNQNRSWLVAVGSGTLIGGGLGWFLTRNMMPSHPEKRTAISYFPYVGFSPSTVSGQGPSRNNGWVAGLGGTW